MADENLPLAPGLRPQEGLPEQAVRRQSLRQQAYVNLLDGPPAPEARAARQVGRQLGVSPAAVQADLPGFQRDVENQSTLSMLGDPHVTAFVADPSNAAAVKDDLPSLSSMSAIIQLNDQNRDPRSFANYMRRSVKDKGLISALTMLPQQKRDPKNDYLGAYIPEKTSRVKGVIATTDNFFASAAGSAQLYLADALGFGDQYKETGWYKAQRDFAEVMQDVGQRPSEDIARDPNIGPVAKWAGQRAYEATQSLAIMGASIATGAPILTLAGGTGLQQYGEVRARGGTANEALFSGGVSGAAEGIFERYFGLGWMLGNFGKKATGKFLGGLLLREVPSEMATTAVQDWADAMVTGGEGWDSYVKRHTALSGDNPILQTAASTAMMVGMVGGGHYVANRLRPEQRSMEEIGKAAAGAEFVDRLMTAAENSKVRKEDPETIRDFVAQRTEATPVRNLYVPVETVAEYMQSEDYDGSLDRYQDQIAQAQATQGDVVIPVADAVAHLAGTKTWEALRDQARVEPGGLSRKEALEKHAEIISVLEQRGKEIAAEAANTEEKNAPSAEVYVEVKNRLKMSGIDDKQADAVAQIYAARYEARAGRMGGTAMEQFRKSKISFQGETPGQFSESRTVAQDTVLNIGLDIPGGGSLSVEEATKALKDIGVNITESEIRQSASEPTLIARLSRPLTAEEGTKLSETLRQEAIAQRSGDAGELFGPMAAKWGPFNPDFFLEPTQRQLNQDASLLGYEGLSQYLGDDEKQGLRDKAKAKIMSLVESLPHVMEFAAAAVAGRAKRGWYEQSAQAILDVFGPTDAPRFAYLLAALSPQTSVESNLYNALMVWTNWNNAGRPTDRKTIVQIMGDSVQGKKGSASVLGSWIPNSFAALSTQDLSNFKLSGPKVDSFAANLVGAVDEVTNDTWMAIFAGVEPTTFKKTGQNKGPGYKAMNAVVRRAAEILTKKTGTTWTPAEVQETVWSFAKTLYEMRDSAGENRTMKELLKAGQVTHADIANTPDFALLFTDGVFKTILEQGGYGEQIAALEGRGQPIDLDGNAPITQAEGTGFSQRDLERFLNRAATRLEQVREKRKAQSRVLNQDVLPEVGWTPERISGLIDSFGKADGSSSAMAVMMSPDEFLGLNASEQGREIISERIAKMDEYGGRLDVLRLNESAPIYLGIKLGNEPSEWQKSQGVRPPNMVSGHSGRHRMMMLKQAGVTRYPVVVELIKPDGTGTVDVKEPMTVGPIGPNRSRSDQTANGDLSNLEIKGVPISWRYKEELEELNDRVLFQTNEDVFYSAAEAAVANSSQNKATAEQWKALLTPGKTPGIKTEEIEWTGIHDWLDMQKGPIEKGALLQVLRDKGIKVSEVVQGALPDELSSELLDQTREEYVTHEFERQGNDLYDLVLDIFAEDGKYAMPSDAGPFIVRRTGLTEDMQTPPPIRQFDTYDDASSFVANYESEQHRKAAQEARARFDAMSPEEQVALADRYGFVYRRTSFKEWSSDQSNPTYRELLITLPLGQGSNPDRAPDTHWDTEAVVAHVRFMEKTDAEGKRVLFIEEVQSDWHQKGRDQGYEAEPSPEAKARVAAVQEQVRATEEAYRETAEEMTTASKRLTDLAEPFLRRDYDRLVADIEERAKTNEKLTPEAVQAFKDVMRTQMGINFYDTRGDGGSYVSTEQVENWLGAAGASADTIPDDIKSVMNEASKLRTEMRDLNKRLDLRHNELRQAQAALKSGIPEAPFKTSWPALVMKRAIRWAVDNGFERIAWTTGEEQAARYNLSQVTGPIRATRQSDGRYGINLYSNAADMLVANGVAEDSGGEQGIHNVVMSKEQMAEAFGRDVAERLTAGADAAPLIEGKITKNADGSLSATQVPMDFTLEGEDLRIGGEGMKAFYDRNLVNITNDIIKKYGAKVGKLKIINGREDKKAYDEMEQYVADAEEALALARKIDGPDQIADWEEAVASRREALEQSRIPRHPGFEITDKMREAARGGFTLFQNAEGPRGTTTVTNDGQHIISLFASANRSTLLHETGHIWLEELKADAETSAEAKRDYEIVKKWWASQGVQVGKSGFIPTEGHELWARGIERYFMEGKAPSVQLQGVFRQFRGWLLRIYQVVQNLRSPITPEIREVFDRLLATQDAIDDARAQNATEPLFKTAEEAGMTEAEFADYQSRIANARDEAYDTLLYKTMEAIRKRKTAERRQQRSSIRAEVAQEIAARPQFRLLHLLRTGKWLGDPDRPAVDVKLNTGWLIDNFGEDILDKLPKGIPVYKGNGETGDVVAEMVGLASGTEVVHTLLGMRATSDALRARGETRGMRDVMVEEEVDRIMAERHGDVLNDGTIEEEAIAALNTARQGEIIGAEIRQLAKRKSVVGVPTPYQFAREWARRTVAAGHVRDVASRSALQRYTRAANKAARLAEEAILAEDVDEAYRQKQAQLLNHALLAEAKAAADRVDKIVARMRKLGSRAAMKSVDPEYLKKIHMLLERYDFRPRSQTSIDEAEGFQQWIEKQRDKGFEVHIPVRLENRGDPYTRVSVEELDSLNDLIESLMHLGRAKQKIKLARAERDFNEFRDEVVARIKGMADRRGKPARWWKSGKLSKISPVGEGERVLAAASAELLKVETIVEEIDGGVTGPLHDAIVVGSTNAENERYALRERVLKPIAQLYHSMSGKQHRRLQERVTIPELTWNTLNEGDPRLGDPVTMTRMELLSVFLNMGNISNLEKLSKGERWPVATLQEVVNRELTKEDMDFAQLLWDQVDKLWPDIVRVEGQLAGVVPEKVIPNPLVTKHGTYQGGYWPVVYDAARWQRAEDMEGKEFDDMFGIKSGVATQKGHTITRTAAFGPINFNLENVLFRHIEQVVTRIAFAEYARDVLRIVRDKQIRGWIDTKLGPEYRKQFEKWLGRQVHEGATHAKAARWWDRLLKQARINVTIAAMGLRISTGVAQTIGLTASMQRIGARWVGVGFKRMALERGAAMTFAYSRSPELLHRTEAVNREVSELNAKMRGKHSWWTNAQSWAMWHIGMIDRYCVAMPTWLGAHARGISEGMTDEEASAFADKSVRLSQGAGREKDLSAIQSPNSEAMRFFTMFYTPFNILFNAQWQGVRGLRDNRKSFAGIPGDPRPLIGVTFWWLIASTLGDAMLSGDWPDEEDDNGWIKWFGRNVFFGLFAGIPLARDWANFEERKITGQYASDPGTTPITRIAQAIAKAQKLGGQLYEGEEVKDPIKNGGDLSAVLLGMPTSQIGTTAQFAWDVKEGDADPQGLSDWYFGITRGKTPGEEGRK